MSLRLIGAGFGRTGTLSLKSAIEKLGAGPCYHMMEVPQNPGHAELWHAASNGEATDWDALLDGYPATVDWPGCRFWRELLATYPDAKVLLSVRTAESWYKSVHGTIYQSMSQADRVTDERGSAMLRMARKIVIEDTFDGRFEDRDYAMQVFERHNDAVRAEVPAERLLVYELGSGWEPLCKFLDVPVPEEEYPHVNTSAEFQDRMREMEKHMRGQERQ